MPRKRESCRKTRKIYRELIVFVTVAAGKVEIRAKWLQEEELASCRVF
jgi:hypothetical protein